MALQGSRQTPEFCNRCYVCGQGIEWGANALHCLQCNFGICITCRQCDPMHTTSIITIRYERYSATAQHYKPVNTCVYCKTAFRARWECVSCKLSACSSCIYDNNRATRYATAHIATHKLHTQYIAIMPPGWSHIIRPDMKLPHPECIDLDPEAYSHCSRCLSVIKLNTWTYQCRTYAVEYGTAQRICSTCYEEDNDRHSLPFWRLLFQLFPTPQPPDNQIRLICERCPELAKQPWSSRLAIEHPHSDLILRMAKERADYTRLGSYRLCARAKRPLLRLSSPRAICSQCHTFLEYWSDIAVCMEKGCNTSFCPACIDEGFDTAHQHRKTVVYVKLFQTAAVASLALGAEHARKLYLATTRHLITCADCQKRDTLLYWEGLFCKHCKSGGRCVTCLAAGSHSATPWCRCLKPNACYNFGLRSVQIFATKVPTEHENAPGFSSGSTLRPCMISYERFPASLKQPIRLLYLQPGKGTQEITFSLNVYSLSSCPQYEALSYTWGSVENPTITKTTTGETFLATTNLASALFRLRYPDKPRVLWIDAVCINQDDTDEVAEQVGFMSSIYGQATQVLIWLGAAASHTSKAFAWLRDEQKRQQILSLQIVQILKVRPDFLDRMRRFGTNDPGVNPYMHMLKSPPIPREVIAPVLEVIRRPYFTRVWIIQETFYAKSIQVLCGPETIDWDTFVLACNTFWHSKELEDDYPRVHGTFVGPSKIADLRGKQEVRNSGTQGRSSSTGIASKLLGLLKGEGRTAGRPNHQADRPFRDLLTVLIGFWDYKATDPRDTVFALLNLVKSHGISISYDRKVSEIFKEVAFSIIEQSQSLELLTIANCAKETGRRLPSWAPDWAVFDSASATLQLNQRYRVNNFEDRFMRKYTASKESVLRNPVRTGNILSLSGYLVDGFARVGPKLPFWNDKETIAMKDTIIDSLLAWDEIAMTPASFSGGQPAMGFQQLETNFYLTLCRGTFWTFAGDANKAMLDFSRWRAALAALRYPMPPSEQAAARTRFLEDESYEVANLALLSWHNYTLARSKSGLLVMALGRLEETDHIALMRGCDLPLVVRASQSIPGQFRLVGAAYVHGIMHGEWWNEKRCQKMDFN